MKWLWWALIAVMSWGLWGVLSAQASKFGSTRGVLAGAVILEAAFVLPLVGDVPKAFSWWLLGVGASGALAYGAMFRALEVGGPPSAVVAITSLYPAVTFLVLLVTVQESVSFRKVVGVCLAIAAALLLSAAE